jgi:hypothetical protein
MPGWRDLGRWCDHVGRTALLLMWLLLLIGVDATDFPTVLWVQHTVGESEPGVLVRPDGELAPWFRRTGRRL